MYTVYKDEFLDNAEIYFGHFCVVLGITNHEEYSLVRELSDEDRMRTLTMKRDRSIAKDQKKLEEMKRKLHTDDECNVNAID